jgi:hypothetical protein
MLNDDYSSTSYLQEPSMNDNPNYAHSQTTYDKRDGTKGKEFDDTSANDSKFNS